MNHQHIIENVILDKSSSICNALGQTSISDCFFSWIYEWATIRVEKSRRVNFLRNKCRVFRFWSGNSNVYICNITSAPSGIISSPRIRSLPILALIKSFFRESYLEKNKDSRKKRGYISNPAKHTHALSGTGTNLVNQGGHCRILTISVLVV